MTPAPKDPFGPGFRPDLQDHCRSLPGVTEDIKWGDHRCFMVGGKLFAIFSTDDEDPGPDGKPSLRPGVSFKASDDNFDELPDLPGVEPAPYAARNGWLRVLPEARLPKVKLKALLSEAHALVGAKLTKKAQREIGLLRD